MTARILTQWDLPSQGPEFSAIGHEIQPMCCQRATALSAGNHYGGNISAVEESAYDGGVRDERRQTVLAETFGMVAAAGQRGNLRVPNAASLINYSYPGCRASCPL
jgi:hypothetical protein